MPDPIRLQRVEAFCEWLATIPPEPSFDQHPGFASFSDLTKDELDAGRRARRIRDCLAAAEANIAEHGLRQVGMDYVDVPAAIYHLKSQVADLPRGNVSVSGDALTVVLSYLEFMEERLDIVVTPGPGAA